MGKIFYLYTEGFFRISKAIDFSKNYKYRQHFSKKAPQKPQAPPQAPPVPPPSSDKDKEDYKEEFEPKPEYGKDFYI
jgi:hypothetical protein